MVICEVFHILHLSRIASSHSQAGGTIMTTTLENETTTEKPKLNRLYEIFYEDLRRIKDNKLVNYGMPIIGLLDDNTIQLRFEGESVKISVSPDTSVQRLGVTTGIALLNYCTTRNIEFLGAALPGLQRHIERSLGRAA